MSRPAVPRPPSAPLAVLALGILGGFALVVAVPLRGLVDGAAHLDDAVVLRHALFGMHPPVSTYLEWYPRPVPNLLFELGLAGLTGVLRPDAAEQVLLLGFVASFPLALLYAIRGLTREADWLALAALPLTFSFALNYGFYNFCYSLVLFLVVAGFALRLPPTVGVRRSALLLLLLVVTYLTHLVGFVEAALLVGLVLGARCARHRRRGDLALLGAVVGLACALLLSFHSSASSAATAYDSRFTSISETLALAWGLVTYSRLEALFAVGTALGLLVLVVCAVRARRPWRGPRDCDVLLAFVAVSFVAVALAPSHIASGGSLVTQRLALFPAIGLVVWLGAQGIASRVLRLTGLGFVAMAVGLALARLPAYREVAVAVDDYMGAAPCIAGHATLIQATLHLPGLDHPFWRSDPLSNEVGRLAAVTDGIDFANVDWAVPYYVLRFRPALDPYTWIPTPARAVQAIPPTFSLRAYERRTGGRVDYVVVAGRERATPEVLRSPAWRSLRGQLRAMYRLVYRSRAGWAEVWERRVPGLARRGSAARAAHRCPTGRAARGGGPEAVASGARATHAAW